ncbi:MAG: tetratricopeptide repeat protein [Anaerolineae bacterium]|nr:tetratricopeptide repeat protein [Anaerolineae bacterium]
MLSTLLATKLHRPRPVSSLVARPRLTQRLDEGLRQGHRLFLVVAPAGYGKTTLVGDWLDRAGAPSAWLSLDEGDNDPLRFFTYVVAALQKALGPQVTQPAPEAFPMTPQSPEAFAHALVNDLAVVERRILLVLDDYHVITSEPIQEAMVFLLRRAPANLHLVVLSRADPPFPLPRLRVRERMTEIRDRDLRFTPAEMEAFLNSLHRLNLPAEQITALDARTEGWAAGVQLAALSLQGCSPERTAEFIRAFSGSHHYIVDYLFEEVLSRQPDAVREFLLQTSILERMCAPLCETILARGAGEPGSSGEGDAASGSRGILDYLQRSNLFLVPLDDARHWYRYHHLFVDVLRGMLQAASQPDQIAALHGHASEWYGQNGFIAEAVHHALLAGDYEQAAEIVEENAWSMVRRAELAILKEWIGALPSESLSARPWLRIYHAWALFFSESEAAEAQLQVVEQQWGADSATALPVEMRGHIAAIRAWIGNMRGEQGRAAVLARQALEFCPQMDAAVRSELAAIWGDGCLVHNDLTGAARAYVEARELARSSGNVMLEVISHAALGVLAVCMGRLREAEAIYQEALQTATRYKSPAAAQAYTDLARVYREWNDLASVRFYAEKLIESAATWGVADAVAGGHLYLALVLQAEGDVPGANRAIAEAGRVMRHHSLELASMPWLGATRARLWLEQGRLDDARRWAETRGLGIEDRFDLWHEIEYSTLVRILLAEGRVEEAMRLLSRLQDAVESTGRHGDLIGVLALRAMALDAQAETGAALAVLKQAVRLARPEGYVRTFLEAGRRIEPLLKIAIGQWQGDDLLPYVRKLLAAFDVEGGRPAAVQASEPAILSERELEVLCLMAAGCSNQEIADELVIALGTTKRHTANIFDKLDVRNRTEAVARARELGLL